LHIQIWHNDQKQINRIYDKIISEYGLFSEYCKINISKNKGSVYNYVIKDYDNSKSDEYLLLLDDVKKDYRSNLSTNIRFSSHSKGKYTKEVYKKAYSKGIKKENVDYLILNCVINEDIEIIDNRILDLVMCFLVPLITSKYILCEYLKSYTEYFQTQKVFRKYQHF